MRRALAAAALLLLAGCGGGEARPAAPSPAERDLRVLAARMQELHPALAPGTAARASFRQRAEALAARAGSLSREQLLVEVMRLTALGDRNGHTGVFVFGANARPLHVYPLRLYDFGDGLWVVDADDPGVVGRRVTAIDGVPLARIEAAARSLVPHDNAESLRLLLPEAVVTEEVLVGLGLGAGGAARFAFADGSTAELWPVPAPSFVRGSALQPLRRPAEPQPLWLRHQEAAAWLTTVDGGHAVYLGYHEVEAPPPPLLDRLIRLARRPSVRRVVVDLRLNGGGDNTTYWGVVDAVRRAGRKAVVLIGRTTFSAAGNLAAVLDDETRARFVGEPTGGSPNQWGDSAPVEVPSLGVTVHVALQAVEVVPGDRRLAVEPDLPVELTAAEFFAGRDPVLARALR
ncbi:MAG: hypothetical protein ACM33B_02180 [Pseudomonadota bacterium]